MRAAVLRGFGEFGIEQVPDPVCGRADVIIDVRCVQPSVTECMLIDGGDVALHDSLAERLRAGPVQFCGVIAEVGPDVPGLVPGQRVTAVETLPCHDCPPCRRERPDSCTAPSITGFTRPGAFAERIAVPAAAVARHGNAGLVALSTLAGRGTVDLERLVTHRLSGLESLPAALAITREKQVSGAINPAQVSLP